MLGSGLRLRRDTATASLVFSVANLPWRHGDRRSSSAAVRSGRTADGVAVRAAPVRPPVRRRTGLPAVPSRAPRTG